MDKKSKTKNRPDVLLEWFPTQKGSYTAYAPEYLHGDEWLRVPCDNHTKNGIPQPSSFGHINYSIGLYGYEQAQALAWGYAAHCAGKLLTKTPAVRVSAYEVHYKIKARRIEENENNSLSDM